MAIIDQVSTTDETLSRSFDDIFGTKPPAAGEVPDYAQEWFAVGIDLPESMAFPDDTAADIDLPPASARFFCSHVCKSTARNLASLINRDAIEKGRRIWTIVRTRDCLEAAGCKLDERPEPQIDYSERFAEAARLAELADDDDIKIRYEPDLFCGDEGVDYERFKHIPSKGHTFSARVQLSDTDNTPIHIYADDRYGSVPKQFAAGLRDFAAEIIEIAEMFDGMAEGQ